MPRWGWALLGIGVLGVVGLALVAGGGKGGFKTWSADEVKARIVAEVARRGYSLNLAQALIVNAYAESALDPYAVGDAGNAVGLYQISQVDPPIPVAGMLDTVKRDPELPAHVGWAETGKMPDPKDPRANIETSTGIMLDAILANSLFIGPLATGASATTLAGLICLLIERPEDAASKALYRANLADQWYGDGIYP